MSLKNTFLVLSDLTEEETVQEILTENLKETKPLISSSTLTLLDLELHKKATSKLKREEELEDLDNDDCLSIATSCISLPLTLHGYQRSNQRFIPKKLLQKTKKNGLKTNSEIDEEICRMEYEGCVAFFSKESGKLITTYFEKQFLSEKLEEYCTVDDPLSLFAACHFGKPELLSKLIIQGADIYVKDFNKKGPYIVALKKLEQLLGRRKLMKTPFGKVKSMIKKQNGNVEITKVMMNYLNCLKYYSAALEVKNVVINDLKRKTRDEACVKVMNLEELKYFINLFGHKEISSDRYVVGRKRSLLMSACLQ